MRAIVLLAVVALWSCQKQPSPEELAFNEAQASVRSTLKDPGSAEFSDMYLCGNSKVVTGEVNAKNSFGGYNGKARFAYADGQAHLEGESGTDGYIRATARCTEEVRKAPAKIPQAKE